MIEDPECQQGLHRIRVELREANIQVQQSLPKERVKGQPEPFKEVVPIYNHVPRAICSGEVE